MFYDLTKMMRRSQTLRSPTCAKSIIRRRKASTTRRRSGAPASARVLVYAPTSEFCSLVVLSKMRRPWRMQRKRALQSLLALLRWGWDRHLLKASMRALLVRLSIWTTRINETSLSTKCEVSAYFRLFCIILSTFFNCCIASESNADDETASSDS